MFIDLNGKVVVITGASRGIGSELAKAFAREGAKVVINYNRSVNEAKKLYVDLKKKGANCIIVKADVTKQTEVSELYSKTLMAYGKVDVLINNAGVCDDNPIQAMTSEQWKRVIDVNLSGVFYCCKAFSNIMMIQRSGKIINIASLKGQEGCANQANYSASKAGTIGLTMAIAKELGNYNIAVNAVCPNYITTDLNRNDPQKKIIAQSRNLLPLKYGLSDTLSLILFLSSDLIKGVSGKVFNVDSRV